MTEIDEGLSNWPIISFASVIVIVLATAHLHDQLWSQTLSLDASHSRPPDTFLGPIQRVTLESKKALRSRWKPGYSFAPLAASFSSGFGPLETLRLAPKMSAHRG